MFLMDIYAFGVVVQRLPLLWAGFLFTVISLCHNNVQQVVVYDTSHYLVFLVDKHP